MKSSNKSFIFHNPGFVNQIKALFYLKVLLGNSSLPDKCPGKCTSKTRHIEAKATFLMKILVTATTLKTQMNISRSKIEYDKISET